MEKKLKNKIRLMLNVMIIVLMIPGMYIGWRYKNGLILKNNALYWISVIVFWPSLFEFIFSLVTKESISKGVVISREQTPNLYIISVIATLALCLLSGFGIYYYY